MHIESLLKTTHFTCDRHQNQLFHPYIVAAENLIRTHRQINTVGEDKLIFLPAYTSRASPGVVLIKSTGYVIGDCHFVELVYNLNRLAISQSMVDANDPLSRSVFTEKSLIQNFRALLFRYLTFRLFKVPHLSLALSEAYAELACPLSFAVRTADMEHLEKLSEFQWTYVLNHEISHIVFRGLSFHQKKDEFDWVLKTINSHTSMYSTVSAHSGEAVKGEWWARDHELYVANQKQFSEQICNSFDKRIAEEISCDILAHRMNLLNWCLHNKVEYSIDGDACLAALSCTLSAANLINNYQHLLSLLSEFWVRISKSIENGSLLEHEIEKIWTDTNTNAQETFLRGDMGANSAMLGSLASLKGESAIRLDDPQVFEYLNKCISARRTPGTLEHFENRLSRAWSTLSQTAGVCIDTNLVMNIVNRAIRSTTKLSKAEALKQSMINACWDF